MIRGFWHVSFTVRDIDASVKWYTEVLGLEYVRSQEQANEYTDKLVAYKNAHLKVAQLCVPGDTIPLSRHHIELVEYVNPRGEDIPLDTNRTGVGQVVSQFILLIQMESHWSWSSHHLHELLVVGGTKNERINFCDQATHA